jgi:hypothetical protein
VNSKNSLYSSRRRDLVAARQLLDKPFREGAPLIDLDADHTCFCFLGVHDGVHDRSGGAKKTWLLPHRGWVLVGAFSCWHTQLSDSRRKSSPSPSSRYATTCSAVILCVSAIVVTPLVVVSEGLDESERHGGRTTHRLRPTPSYTTPWDVTQALRLAKRAVAGRSRDEHSIGTGGRTFA